MDERCAAVPVTEQAQRFLDECPVENIGTVSFTGLKAWTNWPVKRLIADLLAELQAARDSRMTPANTNAAATGQTETAVGGAAAPATERAETVRFAQALLAEYERSPFILPLTKETHETVLEAATDFLTYLGKELGAVTYGAAAPAQAEPLPNIVSKDSQQAQAGDREMLLTLAQEFEVSTHFCERCGEADDLKTFDCAHMLRDYLAKHDSGMTTTATNVAGEGATETVVDSGAMPPDVSAVRDALSAVGLNVIACRYKASGIFEITAVTKWLGPGAIYDPKAGQS